MKVFINYMRKLLLTFVIIFSVAFFAYIMIEYLIFKQNIVRINYIIYITLIIAVGSIVLSLFYLINNISSVIQALVTYTIITLVIYGMGMISGWFNHKILEIILYGILFSGLGALILTSGVMVRNHLRSKELNEELLAFKKSTSISKEEKGASEHEKNM